MRQKQSYDVLLSMEEISRILNYCILNKIKFIFDEKVVYIDHGGNLDYYKATNNSGYEHVFQLGSARSHQFAKAFKFDVNLTAQDALQNSFGPYDSTRYCRCIGNIKLKIEKLIKL